jgi:NAD+ dependent glucose-6-phosphate dehydrogenase
MTKTVVITGANGNLGTKLRRHFESLGWTLRLLDIDDGGDPAVTASDLAQWHDSWVFTLADADALLLLAGDPWPDADWASIERLNLDLTLNVYEAAARQRVKRVIFASSNWTMGGYRSADGPLTTDLTPSPVNPYGASKLVGERLGRSYAERWGMSVICFRIGYCQRGENLPGPHMSQGVWGQQMWLSNRDLCDGFEKAIIAPPDLRFAVLNLMSDNPGMRWDIETTKRLIGYVPRDGHAAVEPQPTEGRR